MLTKGAIGNLVNRYRAVLKKCNLINTFGSLAVASMLVLGGAGVAMADYTNLSQDTTLTNNFDGNYILDDDKKTIVLDLNGYNIDHTNDDDAIWIRNGHVVIKNSSDTESSIKHTNNSNGAFGVYVSNASSLVVEKGVNIQAINEADASYGITVYGNGAKLTVNGATIKGGLGITGNGTPNSDGSPRPTSITINDGYIEGADGAGIYHPQAGTLTLNGGTIKGGNAGVEMRSGSLIVDEKSTVVVSATKKPSGGTANDSGTTIVGAALGISQHTTNVPINVSIANGTFTGYTAIYIEDTTTDADFKDGTLGHHFHDTTIDISGGTFNGEEYALYIKNAVNPDAVADGEEALSLSITGGTFNGKIESKDALVTNFIHGGNFNDLSALGYIGAAAEGTNGATVTLDENAEIASSQTISAGKVTLDLNGQTIASTNTAAKNSIMLGLVRGADLTIKDSSAEGTGIITSNGNDVAGVFFSGSYGGQGDLYKLTVESGTISGDNFGIVGSGSRHGSEININGGTIKAIDGTAIYHPQEGTLNIKDGVIEGAQTGIEMRGGKAVITGGTITGKGDPFGVMGNSSGTTTVGAALAVSQYYSDSREGGHHDIDITIKGGTFTGKRAFYEEYTPTGSWWLTQGDAAQKANLDKLKVSIEGGTFNGEIFSQNLTDFISGGTFSDESALKYLAPKASIIVTDAEIGTYENEAGDEHSITFGAEGGSTVEEVKLAAGSTTTFDGKAAIEKMTAGDDATLNINSADISAGTSELSKANVNVSGDVNDALGGAEGLAAQLGTNNIGNLNMEEGLIAGAVTNGVQKVNTVLSDTLEQATAAPLAVNRILMNDVRKRMGDLRADKNESGVWMRWDGGKLQGDGLTNNFNTLQIGGDTKVAKNCRFGVAGSFTHGDVDQSNGGGELETYTFAAYGTWMAENGMFADVIARVGFTNAELQVKGSTADIDNEALSLSAEYGWRLPVCDQFFLEPQVELTYTHVTGADFSIQSAQYDIDSVDSVIGRAGLVAGWNLPNDMGNVYARASVVHEFLGDAKISATNNGGFAAHELDGSDTWLEYGIGANVKLTDKTYVWADVERTEGAELDEEWRGTVGIRYSF